MPNNLVDAVLSEEDRAAIAGAVEEIDSRMPFLVDLSPDERRKLFKMGRARLMFVRDALTVAKQHPDILPGAFDVDAFERDLELAEQLDEILIKLTRILEHVDDTRRLAGTEALRSARLVYKYVRSQPHGQALDGVAAMLAASFRRSSSGGGNGAASGDGQ